jgi:hypothetical protein
MHASIGVVTFNTVPPGHPTLKYAQLGVLNSQRLRRWCEHHGYQLYDAVPDFQGLQPCWGKFVAILAALQHHPWVLWVDSDAAPLDLDRSVTPLLDPARHLIFQAPQRWFKALRQDCAIGMRTRPWNTGVFLVQATQWARSTLQIAYSRAPSPPGAAAAAGAGTTPDGAWNGVGDQEALTTALHNTPCAGKIGFADDLQDPPQDYRGRAPFVHFYGDRGNHWLPAQTCHAALAQLHARLDRHLPAAALGLLHWCAIQHLSPTSGLQRGGPERFGYDPQNLLGQIPRMVASSPSPCP